MHTQNDIINLNIFVIKSRNILDRSKSTFVLKMKNCSRSKRVSDIILTIIYSKTRNLSPGKTYFYRRRTAREKASNARERQGDEYEEEERESTGK